MDNLEVLSVAASNAIARGGILSFIPRLVMVAALVRPSYVPNATQAVFDDESPDCPARHEVTASGYNRVNVSFDLVTDKADAWPALNAKNRVLAFGSFGSELESEWIGGVVLSVPAASDRLAKLFGWIAIDPAAPVSGGPVSVELAEPCWQLRGGEADPAMVARAQLFQNYYRGYKDRLAATMRMDRAIDPYRARKERS